MNMYGDLVMDTVPEKVGLTRYFSPQENFHSSEQLFSPFLLSHFWREVGEGHLLNSNL